MNAEQFIEFANNFAKASAKTSTVQIQQAFEDNLDCLARPGDQVVVIRKPWHIGRWGTVIAFHELDPCYFRVEVDIEGSAYTFQLQHWRVGWGRPTVKKPNFNTSTC